MVDEQPLQDKVGQQDLGRDESRISGTTARNTSSFQDVTHLSSGDKPRKEVAKKAPAINSPAGASATELSVANAGNEARSVYTGGQEQLKGLGPKSAGLSRANIAYVSEWVNNELLHMALTLVLASTRQLICDWLRGI